MVQGSGTKNSYKFTHWLRAVSVRTFTQGAVSLFCSNENHWILGLPPPFPFSKLTGLGAGAPRRFASAAHGGPGFARGGPKACPVSRRVLLPTQESQVSLCTFVGVVSLLATLIAGDLVQWTGPSVAHVIVGVHCPEGMLWPLVVGVHVGAG